jgi:CDP-diacylglycerol--glycerol-3-phosphate 3-phosphatidyltransferase
MNLPNQLTLGRVGLTFLMVVLLTFPIPFGKTGALLVFALAGLTDYWDGRLARSLKRISAFGQLMDPLADKILVCAAFVSFVAVHQIVPAWIVIIIISREFLITGLRLLAAKEGRVLPAGKWGKHKMIWQTVAISAILVGLALQEDILPLVHAGSGTLTSAIAGFNRYFSTVSFIVTGLVAVLTVVSGAVYFWESRDLVLDHI